MEVPLYCVIQYRSRTCMPAPPQSCHRAIAYGKQGTLENSKIGFVVSSRSENVNRMAIWMGNPLVLNERKRSRPGKLAMMVTVAAP